MLISFEACESFQSHYKPKLALLLLIWLCTPSRTTTSPPHQHPPLPPSIKAVTSIDGTRAISVEIKDAGRVTAPWPHHVPDMAKGKTTAMPVKGATSIATVSEPSVSPPLTRPPHHREETPPAATSTSSSTDCPIDYRGRPICPDTPIPSHSLTERSNELADSAREFALWFLTSSLSLFLSIGRIRINPSPFWITFLLSHVLYFVHVVALAMEERIVKTSLANPLPPGFPTRSASLQKRLNRMRWRARATWVRFGREIIVLLGLVAILGMVARECWSDEEGGVPFGRMFDSKNESEEWVLLRRVLKIEVCASALALIHPISHLLPTPILPTTITLPSHRTTLETSYLLQILLQTQQSLLTLFQLLLILPSLPSYSLLSPAPHLVFHLIAGRLKHVRDLRKGLWRTVECLRLVLAGFGNEVDGAEEEEWVCTICFESGGGGNAGDSSKERTGGRRCTLPCSHSYHAACLVHWFHYQSWCPICHEAVLPPSPNSFASSTSNQRDGMNVHPGNVRQMRRTRVE